DVVSRGERHPPPWAAVASVELGSTGADDRPIPQGAGKLVNGLHEVLIGVVELDSSLGSSRAVSVEKTGKEGAALRDAGAQVPRRHVLVAQKVQRRQSAAQAGGVPARG